MSRVSISHCTYVVCLLGISGGASAQFVPLHPGPAYEWSEGMGVSDNGVVVGNADTLGDTDYEPWTWTTSGGQVFSEVVGSYLRHFRGRFNYCWPRLCESIRDSGSKQ
ncbi:MAG TPA: hypothetical protein PKA27_14250 [Fimbriimonadaceae bacterium]|nr:hypothetical protein [Fimbriimonadaceae bacterium]